MDEIVIFEDAESGGAQNADSLTAFSNPSHYLAHLLSYLETPPHLRKRVFPMHPNLRTAGLLPSLDMPHHLRQNEWCDYREGVVVGQRGDTQAIVDTGLSQQVTVPAVTSRSVPEGSRVTVRFSSQDPNALAEFVDPSTPREEAGYYWGYSVRRCSSLSSVFTECPFDGGYDLSFGTSERGIPLSDIEGNPQRRELPNYKHLLLVFGGVAGLETAVRNDPQLRDMSIRPVDVDKLFDYWVNLLPGQGSRTIRTEEAVWIGLTRLMNLVDRKHQSPRDGSAPAQDGSSSTSQRNAEQHDDGETQNQDGDQAGHGYDAGKQNKKKKKSKKEKRGLS